MSAATTTGPSNLVTSALANWVGFAVQVLVTLWMAPLMLHGLGDARYGIWSLVESVLAYLMLFDLGVAASVVRYVARFEATRDRDSLNRVFSTSVCIFAVAGLLVFLLSVIGALAGGYLFDLPPDLEVEGRCLLVLLGFNLAVGLPLGVYPCVLDGLGRYPAKTAIRTVTLLIRVPLFLMVVWSDLGLVGLGWVITGLNVAEHLTMAVVVRRYLPQLRFSLALADRATFRTIRGYSLDAFLAMVAGRISFQTDAIVIGAFLAPQYITFFAVAGKLVDYAKTALRTLTAVLTPAASTLEARGDTTAIRRMLLNSTRYTVWVLLPIQIGLLLLGKPFLVNWLGSRRYADLCFPTLVILALPLTLAMSQSVPARILYGIGRLRWYARAMMAEALVNLVLSILLVRPLGIEGVAWGTTIPNVLSSLAVGVYVCRLLGVRLGAYLRHSFLLPVAASSLLAAGWGLAACWLDLTSWGAWLLTGTAGLAGYLLLAALAEFGPQKVLRGVKGLTSGWPRGLVPAASRVR
jgi:O-antigen/teichoic acid export membrane protein